MRPEIYWLENNLSWYKEITFLPKDVLCIVASFLINKNENEKLIIDYWKPRLPTIAINEGTNNRLLFKYYFPLYDHIKKDDRLYNCERLKRQLLENTKLNEKDLDVLCKTTKKDCWFSITLCHSFATDINIYYRRTEILVEEKINLINAMCCERFDGFCDIKIYGATYCRLRLCDKDIIIEADLTDEGYHTFTDISMKKPFIFKTGCLAPVIYVESDGKKGIWTGLVVHGAMVRKYLQGYDDFYIHHFESKEHLLILNTFGSVTYHPYKDLSIVDNDGYYHPLNGKLLEV